jgi:hypothetical protein
MEPSMTKKVPECAVECTGIDMYVEGGRAGLRYTWAGLSAMTGMPLMVVARKLGTRIVEKHYGHLAPSYVAETIRQYAPKFAVAATNVAAIR